MDDELKVLIVKESFWQSILLDIFTFGCLLAVLYLNHHYCGSSWMVEITIVACFWVSAFKHGSKKVETMKPEEAHKYLDKLMRLRKGEKVDAE